VEIDAALASQLLRHHPDEAARVLETLLAEQAAAALDEAHPEISAGVLRRLAPHALDGILPALDPEALARAVSLLDTDVAARVLRRLPEALRAPVLAHLDDPLARSLRTLLRHPEHTAGALLDPDVLSLPASLDAKEAIAYVRAHPERARYNLYVTDAEQRLVGVLNLRELLLAPADAPLRELMRPATHRLPAHADRHQIAAHPGWRDVHALPVLDPGGAYLGTIRYRTLRQIEREIADAKTEGNAAARALGELYLTGASSLVEALTGGRRGSEPLP
jgi:magnesium transporter